MKLFQWITTIEYPSANVYINSIINPKFLSVPEVLKVIVNPENSHLTKLELLVQTKEHGNIKIIYIPVLSKEQIRINTIETEYGNLFNIYLLELVEECYDQYPEFKTLHSIAVEILNILKEEY